MSLSAPVDEQQRLDHLDVLRGFALLGILLVNFQFFTRPMTSIVMAPDPSMSGLDQIASGLIAVLAETKFYALFSMLFGAGFALMLHRAHTSDSRFWPLYLRRIAVLMAFGAAHVLLVWPGDILFIYGLLALLMVLFFRNTPTRRLPKWGVLLLALPAAINGVFAGLIQLASNDPKAAREITSGFEQQQQNMTEFVQATSTIYQNGGFTDALAQRLSEYLMMLSWSPFWVTPMLRFFLLGRWLIASGRLRDVTCSEGFFRAWRNWGLTLGLPLACAGYWLMLDQALHIPSSGLALASALTSAGAALLAMGYLGLISLNAQHLGWLAPAGRMALSNYLLQSLVWTTLFYGYGFGLWGEISRAAQLPLALLFFAGQVIISHWWLARFRFGPAEWLWRTLTYGARQPMRRSRN